MPLYEEDIAKFKRTRERLNECIAFFAGMGESPDIAVSLAYSALGLIEPLKIITSDADRFCLAIREQVIGDVAVRDVPEGPREVTGYRKLMLNESVDLPTDAEITKEAFEKSPRGHLPADFPHVSILADGGVTTWAQLRKHIAEGTLTGIPGIADARAAEITEAYNAALARE